MTDVIQPGRRRARLRHAAAGDRGRPAQPGLRPNHYASNYGTIELRRALAHHLERLYGVRYDPTEEILITIGASEALDVAVARPSTRATKVVMHEPSYVSYRPLSSSPAACRWRADDPGGGLRPGSARSRRPSLRGQGHPASTTLQPHRAVLPPEVQDEIARIAVRHDLLVYSDEIYDRLVYGGYQCGRWAGCRACAVEPF